MAATTLEQQVSTLSSEVERHDHSIDCIEQQLNGTNGDGIKTRVALNALEVKQVKDSVSGLRDDFAVLRQDIKDDIDKAVKNSLIWFKLFQCILALLITLILASEGYLYRSFLEHCQSTALHVISSIEMPGGRR